MWYEILSLGKHPLTGVVPSYGTLIPPSQRYPPGPHFGPFGSVLSMSAEQIASKWPLRLVGNTRLAPLQMEGLRWCDGPHER